MKLFYSQAAAAVQLLVGYFRPGLVLLMAPKGRETLASACSRNLQRQWQFSSIRFKHSTFKTLGIEGAD